MIEYLDLLMFAVAILVLLLGFPVAFSLAGIAIIFALVGDYFGVFPIQFLKAIPQRIFGTMTNEVLMAVPLFIFMGTILEKSKVAEDLLENMSKLIKTCKGWAWYLSYPCWGIISCFNWNCRCNSSNNGAFIITYNVKKWL